MGTQSLEMASELVLCAAPPGSPPTPAPGHGPKATALNSNQGGGSVRAKKGDPARRAWRWLLGYGRARPEGSRGVPGACSEGDGGLERGTLGAGADGPRASTGAD